VKDFSEMTSAELQHFYEVEKALARGLRDAPRTERLELYGVAYDKLFEQIPYHPQLKRKHDHQAERENAVSLQIQLLRPLIAKEDTFLEIGAGDCALSIAIANQVRKVYALDVSETISSQVACPANFELIISDGVSIPLPDRSVDFAYSNQLMEHLHPDDAVEQLANIRRALRDGGRYLCLTPSALSGPHDVSRFFDEVATGFHLKEYSYQELAALFKAAGFRRVLAYLGHQRRANYIEAPLAIASIIEKFAGRIIRGRRYRDRMKVMGRLPYRLISDIRMIGIA
jgi:SAM-dependent methyltransferase